MWLSTCSATIPGCRAPAARISGSDTEPSPPSPTGTAPASRMRLAAASMRAKASSMRAGVSRTSPASTTPRRASTSSSAPSDWKRRTSPDWARIACGPWRAPMRKGCVPQSNGQPRIAAAAPAASRACGTSMKVAGPAVRAAASASAGSTIASSLAVARPAATAMLIDGRRRIKRRPLRPGGRLHRNSRAAML